MDNQLEIKGSYTMKVFESEFTSYSIVQSTEHLVKIDQALLISLAFKLSQTLICLHKYICNYINM